MVLGGPRPRKPQSTATSRAIFRMDIGSLVLSRQYIEAPDGLLQDLGIFSLSEILTVACVQL